MDGEGGPGEWLWKIEEGSGMWIGVAEEARFGPGYQLKVSSPNSIFVKVASAGAAVRGSWQPLRRLVSCYRALGAKVCDWRQCWHEGSLRVLKYGFLVVVKVEVVDGSTVVSFRHNDTALGAAFNISGWTGGNIRPVVSHGS